MPLPFTPWRFEPPEKIDNLQAGSRFRDWGNDQIDQLPPLTPPPEPPSEPPLPGAAPAPVSLPHPEATPTAPSSAPPSELTDSDGGAHFLNWGQDLLNQLYQAAQPKPESPAERLLNWGKQQMEYLGRGIEAETGATGAQAAAELPGLLARSDQEYQATAFDAPLPALGPVGMGVGMAVGRLSAAARAAKKTETLLRGLNDPDLERVLKNFTTKYVQEAEFARRGTVPISESMARAREPEVIAKALAWKPGEILDEAHLEALADMAVQSADEVTAMEKAVASGTGTQQALDDLDAAAAALFIKFQGASAEPGRALRILREVRQRHGLTPTVANPAEAADPFIHRYMYFNMLSSPKTWEINAVASAIKLAEDLAVTAIVSPATARSAALGIVRGFPKGLAAATNIIKKGEFLPGDVYAEGITAASHIPGRNPYAGVLGVPARALASMDMLFRHLGGTMKLYQMAAEQASSLGFKGSAFDLKVADLVQNPTLAMIKAAREQAALTTFTQKLGKRGQAIANLQDLFGTVPGNIPIIGGLQPGRLMIPFARTLINVAKADVAFSPLGATRALKPGASALERKVYLAQAGIGSTIGLALLALSGGQITAGAPRSKSGREERYRAEGFQPWSVKIGGHWINYTNIPGANLMLAGIGMWKNRAQDFAPGDEGDFMDLTDALVQQIGSLYLDRSLLSGLGDFLNIVEEGNALNRFGKLVGSSMLPASSLGRYTARLESPQVRENRDFLEMVERTYPFLQRFVPARIEPTTGKPVERPRNIVADVMSPFPVSRSGPQTETAQALAEAGVRPGKPRGPITVRGEQIELSPDEQHEYERLSGQYINRALHRLFADSRFQGLSQQGQKAVTERRIAFERDRARDTLRRQLVVTR